MYINEMMTHSSLEQRKTLSLSLELIREDFVKFPYEPHLKFSIAIQPYTYINKI